MPLKKMQIFILLHSSQISFFFAFNSFLFLFYWRAKKKKKVRNWKHSLKVFSFEYMFLEKRFVFFLALVS